MKVILLIQTFSRGGAEQIALWLATYFREEKKLDAEIWGFEKGDGSMIEQCKKQNIPFTLTGKFYGLRSKLGVLQKYKRSRMFRQSAPDAIISFNNLPNLLNALIWKSSGTKTAIWNQLSVGTYPFQRAVEKKVIGQMPCFVSNSFHGSKFLQEKLLVPASKIVVIPSGIPRETADYNASEVLRRTGIPADAFRAVMVASLTEVKDHATLLRAWRIVVDDLRKCGKEAVLALCGRLGNQTAELYRLAYELDIFPNLRFLGNFSDVRSLNEAMHLGILSSRAEGLSTSVIEYMDAGLAVVGTDIPGIREALPEQNAHLLAAAGDSHALAQAILKIAKDPEEAKKIGELNRVHAASFSIQAMAEKYYSLIQKTRE